MMKCGIVALQVCCELCEGCRHDPIFTSFCVRIVFLLYVRSVSVCLSFQEMLTWRVSRKYPKSLDSCVFFRF